MTREEALAKTTRQLGNARYTLKTSKNKAVLTAAANKIDYLTAVQAALRPVRREQVEKVWRGEWAKRHKRRGGFRRVTGMNDMGEQHEVTIDERCEYDDLYCSKCGRQSPDNFLNFCGYCGAPMTDEAVEMVMERLEALYGKAD